MRLNHLAATLAAFTMLSPYAATAEIKLTGDAKMGLSFDGKDLRAKSGARVTAHAYGVTDGGLEYGVVMDMDVSGYDPEEQRGYVYLSGGNHSLQVGQGVKSAVGGLIGPSLLVSP